MAKKVLEVPLCENCEVNEASHTVRSEGEDDMLLCSPCQKAYQDGQGHPEAVIEPLDQEAGIDEDIFEDEGESEID